MTRYPTVFYCYDLKDKITEQFRLERTVVFNALLKAGALSPGCWSLCPVKLSSSKKAECTAALGSLVQFCLPMRGNLLLSI